MIKRTQKPKNVNENQLKRFSAYSGEVLELIGKKSRVVQKCTKNPDFGAEVRQNEIFPELISISFDKFYYFAKN